MKIDELARILNGEIMTLPSDADQIEITMACGSDMMSDVIAFVKEKVALLTGLTNPQVLRTAELMDIRVIIFVRGKRPAQEIIQIAQEQNIALICTKDSMFVACGKLYQAGIKGDSCFVGC